MIKAEFNDSINDLTTENLYQWDSYQTLQISGINFTATPKVHFANKKSTEALVVQGILKGGVCEVSIPNSLLADKYDIIAYIYTNTGVTFKTIKSITIPIIPRLKPTNYTQPSNDQISKIEAIELQAKAIIDGLTASNYNPNVNYKRPNIVYYKNATYMCNSNTEIKNIPPTNTNYWQLITTGQTISTISVSDDGLLQFTFSNGDVQTISFYTKTVSTDDDIIATKVTDGTNNVAVSDIFDFYTTQQGLDESAIEYHADAKIATTSKSIKHKVKSLGNWTQMPSATSLETNVKWQYDKALVIVTGKVLWAGGTNKSLFREIIVCGNQIANDDQLPNFIGKKTIFYSDAKCFELTLYRDASTNKISIKKSTGYEGGTVYNSIDVYIRQLDFIPLVGESNE